MIETKNLSKHFGPVTAVDDISFEVGEGEVLGFLGPNGAGKSTTMKMIAGFVAPTSGSISVCGHDVATEPVASKSQIGYLPEGAPSYGEMTVGDFIDFVADIRGLTGDRKRLRVDEIIERLHLEPVLEQSIETLSKGFKRRVGLGQAILHDPKVLILDEPTDGLDPNQKHEVRELIRTIAEDKTIIISTHILEEVHAVCNRAIIIAAGKILADDTPAALEARSRYHNAVSLKLTDRTKQNEVKEKLRTVTAVTRLETDEEGRIVALAANGAAIFPAISDLALRHEWDLEELSVEPGRLDEVFREITMGEEER